MGDVCTLCFLLRHIKRFKKDYETYVNAIRTRYVNKFYITQAFGLALCYCGCSCSGRRTLIRLGMESVSPSSSTYSSLGRVHLISVSGDRYKKSNLANRSSSKANSRASRT